MAKNMCSIHERWIKGVSEDFYNEVKKMWDGLTDKGREKFTDKLEENSTRIRRREGAEREKLIREIMGRVSGVYVAGSEGVENPYIAATQRAVLQIDKKTGVVIARHNGVREAEKNTGVSDGSICYCCLHKPGYKSAGGFKWEYEENYVAPQTSEE